MKALRCLNCKGYIIVNDNAEGYCTKCHMELQEDKCLSRELKLEKDEPTKRKYIKKDKKIKPKKTKNKEKIKKTKITKKIKKK